MGNMPKLKFFRGETAIFFLEFVEFTKDLMLFDCLQGRDDLCT